MSCQFERYSKWPNLNSGKQKQLKKQTIIFFLKLNKNNSLASYSRSLREQGLVDSAVDLDDFEQDFGKPKTTSGYGGGEGSTTTASKKIKKGFLLNVKKIFTVSSQKHTLCTPILKYYLSLGI